MTQYFKKVDYFAPDYIQMMNDELNKMLDSRLINWHEHHKQIGITTHKDYQTKKFSNISPHLIGTGSLIFNWADSGVNKEVEKRTEVEEFKERLHEKDFNVLSPEFKGTIFEDFYNKLKQKHRLGRLRFMKMIQRKCLSWHNDYSPRIHTVLDTSEGNFMIIENEVKHLEQNTSWITDTTFKHTALNASMNPRTHIVGVLLDE